MDTEMYFAFVFLYSSDANLSAWCSYSIEIDVALKKCVVVWERLGPRQFRAIYYTRLLL